MIKLKNILAENMRRFGTKNLSEQQLDLFKMDSDNEYYQDRPEHDDHVDYETLSIDMERAMNRKDGRAAAKVGEKLLKYLTVGVYDNLKWAEDKAKENPSAYGSSPRQVQSEIDKIQTVNQDVLKNSIEVLRSSPANMIAMQTIYDIIKDLHRYTD
jgi:hypothetical protein